MSRHNFLPESFLHAQTRRRIIVRSGLVLVLIVLSTSAYYITCMRQLAVLERRLGELKMHDEGAGQRNSELTKLQTQQKELLALVKVCQTLTPPLDTTLILAAMDKLMPSSMGLTNFSMTSSPIQPTPVPAKGDRSKSRRRASAAAEQPGLPPVKLELTGVAPSDVVVARFVNDLSEHILFDRVKLIFSRSMDDSDLGAREFSIEVEIPLDRRYVVVDSDRKVSHENPF